MADVLDEINAAVASGKEPDDATLDRLIASAQAELGQGQGGADPAKRDRIAAFGQKIRERQAKLEAEPDPMSFGEMAKELPQNMGALAYKALNGATIGGFGAARRYDMGDEAFNREQQDIKQRLGSWGGQAVGNLMDMTGGGMSLGPAAEGLQGMLTKGIPELAKRPVGRALINAITGGGMGAVAETGHAAAEGEDLPGVAKRAALGGGIGAGLGLGMGTIGEAVDYARGSLRNPQSELGETVLRYDKAKQEGRIPRNPLDPRADPPLAAEVKSTRPGQAGVDEVADTVGQEMAAYNNKTAEGAEAKFGAARGAAVDKNKGLNLFPELAQRLDHLERINTVERVNEDGVVTGVTKNPALQASIDKARAMYEGAPDSPSPDQRKVMLGTLHELLQNLDAPTGLARPGGGANHPDVENALTRQARAVGGKEFRGAMDERARTMDRLSDVNDTAFGQRKPVLAEGEGPAAGGERSAAARLSRKIGGGAGGENNLRNPNQAASERQRTELADLDPQYADMLARIDAKAGFEATRFPGPIETFKKLELTKPIQSIAKMVGDYKPALAARVADPLLQSLPFDAGRAQGALPGWIPGIEDAAVTARLEKARQAAQRRLDRENALKKRRH